MSDHPERAQRESYKAAPLVVPDELLIEARKSVQGMLPDEIAFAKSDTVVIDNTTGRLLLDTKDPLSPLIDRIQNRESQPALLRLVRLVGEVAIDGFIVDMRYIKKPRLVLRSENELGALEDSDQWRDLLTVDPLGALFSTGEYTQYIGELKVQDTARRFAESVDLYYRNLAQGMPPDDCYEASSAHFATYKEVAKEE